MAEWCGNRNEKGITHQKLCQENPFSLHFTSEQRHGGDFWGVVFKTITFSNTEVAQESNESSSGRLCPEKEPSPRPGQGMGG